MSEASADYRLTGRVRFRNFVRLREEGEQAIESAGDPVIIDLSELENGNSAGVALLMAWYRAAEALDKRIRFVAAPAELENILELSGLTDVLPVEVDGAARHHEPPGVEAAASQSPSREAGR